MPIPYGQIIRLRHLGGVILPLFRAFTLVASRHALEKAAGLGHWANR